MLTPSNMALHRTRGQRPRAGERRRWADACGVRPLAPAHRGGGSDAPRAGPLAQPIMRLELPGAPASPLACAPAAQPPPRWTDGTP